MRCDDFHLVNVLITMPLVLPRRSVGMLRACSPCGLSLPCTPSIPLAAAAAAAAFDNPISVQARAPETLADVASSLHAELLTYLLIGGTALFRIYTHGISCSP